MRKSTISFSVLATLAELATIYHLAPQARTYELMVSWILKRVGG
jgi:hypothetical protein